VSETGAEPTMTADNIESPLASARSRRMVVPRAELDKFETFSMRDAPTDIWGMLLGVRKVRKRVPRPASIHFKAEGAIEQTNGLKTSSRRKKQSADRARSPRPKPSKRCHEPIPAS
jgi:hypothetical protein